MQVHILSPRPAGMPLHHTVLWPGSATYIRNGCSESAIKHGMAVRSQPAGGSPALWHGLLLDNPDRPDIICRRAILSLTALAWRFGNMCRMIARGRGAASRDHTIGRLLKDGPTTRSDTEREPKSIFIPRWARSPIALRLRMLIIPLHQSECRVVGVSPIVRARPRNALQHSIWCSTPKNLP